MRNRKIIAVAVIAVLLPFVLLGGLVAGPWLAARMFIGETWRLSFRQHEAGEEIRSHANN